MGRKRRISREWWHVGVGAVGFAGVAVLAVAALQPPPVPAGAGKPVVLPSASAAPRLRVAVLGDSHGAGAGARPEGGFLDLTAQHFGWQLLIFAKGGTGYTNPGQGTQRATTYLQRVPAVIAAKPDMVIVEGGTNDRSVPQQLTEAATTVFGQLRKGLPNAKIIVLGPFDSIGITTEHPVRPDPDFVEADKILRARAAAAGLPFVEMLQPDVFGGRQPATVDNTHLTPEEHTRLAVKTEALLAGLVPRN